MEGFVAAEREEEAIRITVLSLRATQPTEQSDLCVTDGKTAAKCVFIQRLMLMQETSQNFFFKATSVTMPKSRNCDSTSH